MINVVSKYNSAIKDTEILRCLQELEDEMNKNIQENVKYLSRAVGDDDLHSTQPNQILIDERNNQLAVKVNGQFKTVNLT